MNLKSSRSQPVTGAHVAFETYIAARWSRVCTPPLETLQGDTRIHPQRRSKQQLTIATHTSNWISTCNLDQPFFKRSTFVIVCSHSEILLVHPVDTYLNRMLRMGRFPNELPVHVNLMVSPLVFTVQETKSWRCVLGKSKWPLRSPLQLPTRCVLFSSVGLCAGVGPLRQRRRQRQPAGALPPPPPPVHVFMSGL